MPDDLITLLEKGYAAQQAGDTAKAEDSYNKVLKRDPSNKHALNLLGMLCVNNQRADEAVHYINRALKVDPDEAQAHANIGLAYKDLGEAHKAARHLTRSVNLNAGNPVIFNNLGNVLRLLDEPKRAIKAYEQALQMDRGFAECWSNLAAALNEAGQEEAGLKAVSEALRLDPELAQAHNNRGDIFLQQARYDAALNSYERAIEINPGYTAALINMAKTQRDMDEPERAVGTLDRAFELDPNNPQAHNSKGILLEQLGDRTAAAEAFKRAIQSAPELALPRYYLAQIKGRTSTEEEFAEVQSLWAKEDVTPNNRMYLAFALARIYEQRDDVDQAYHYLAAANKAKADVRPYDDADTGRYMDGILSATESLLEEYGNAKGYSDSRPVFVLGMPRSGTSLTEQILASHSDISGAGELSYAFDTVQKTRELTQKKFPEGMSFLNAEQLKTLGQYYMGRHSEAYLETQYVVDKSPLNFQYVGLLALVLRGAKFIHCHRNPVANCFAIHRIPFDLKQTYAHSLQGLGQFYSRYWELMQQWKRLFPDRILDVCYEDTVADVETQARRMLDFLDLPFQQAVLDYHKTERLVKTPSASQVREPIYRDSVEAWKKYESHLQPLLENLNI